MIESNEELEIRITFINHPRMSLRSAVGGMILLGLSWLPGCGAEDANRQPALAAVEASSPSKSVSGEPQTQAQAIESGQFRVVAHEDGTVSIVARSAPRLEVLTELATATGFLLEVHTPPEERLTAELDGVTLRAAIPKVIGDVEYQADWFFDEINNQHRLISLTVGYPPGTPEANEVAATEASPPDAFADRGAQLEEVMIVEFLPEIIRERPASGLSEGELRQRLQDPDPRVRMEAAIEIIPEEEGLNDLIGLLNDDPDPGVRAAATVSLENSEQVAGVHALLGALDDPNPMVVIEVIDSLEFAGDESIVPKISPLLEHPDPRVQAAAAEAVRFLGWDEVH